MWKLDYYLNRYLQGTTLVLAIIAFSCESSDEPETFDRVADYLPLRKGSFQVYDVSEIRYELGVPETLSYELKTVVTDSFKNASGTYSYVIHRSLRDYGGNSWTYMDTWSSLTSELEAVTNEGNLSFLKFRLPIKDGIEWNGNLYNAQGEDIYTLEQTKASQTFGETIYNDCITVNQNDNEDFVVFLDQRKEVYGRHVGLVYKESTQLHYCAQEECLGDQIVEEGVIYKQTIKDHGIE